MASLVLGPLQRHADETRVTVWVETDTACEVQVRAVPVEVDTPARDTPHGENTRRDGGGPPGRPPGRPTGEPTGEPTGRSSTFAVAGHHYAVVVVEGLTPGVAVPYEVALDGECVWPSPGDPPSLLRPFASSARRLRVAFGSCRVTAPQERPYTLGLGEHRRGLGTDALHALALRMRSEDAGNPAAWPDVLLMLGDQVYADHVDPATLAWIRSRRDTAAPPGEEIADFEEYAHLYVEAWSQPEIRWLLSTVPTAMIFDDHDVRDDWNISAAWRAAICTQPWWEERIIGGITAYWIYQHVGNLDPDTRAADRVFAALTTPATPATPATSASSAAEGAADEAGGTARVIQDTGMTGAALLREVARRVNAAADGTDRAHGTDRTDSAGGTDRTDGTSSTEGNGDEDGTDDGGDRDIGDRDIGAGVRWSFRWDIGRCRLVVIDSRCARVLAPDGRRLMVDEAEWEWVRAQTKQGGEVDHLLIATSLPYLLFPGIHWVEAASEPLAAGRWGRRVARLTEAVRQTIDLEHWSAFGRSFDTMTELLRAVAAGEHGPVPASVTVLSGDVHHAYLARAELPGAGCPVHQAVCSPFRNPLGPAIRHAGRLARTRLMVAAARSFALRVGARRPALEWQVTHGPWFDSQIAYLHIDGRANKLRLEKTEPDGTPGGLDEVLAVDLAC
jgi:hypothetical protein